jgi:hypothetical protein
MDLSTHAPLTAVQLNQIGQGESCNDVNLSVSTDRPQACTRCHMDASILTWRPVDVARRSLLVCIADGP